MFAKAKHIVPENTPKIRLSDYMLGLFNELPTRAGIKKAFKRGEVFLNGEQAPSGVYIRQEDEIELMDFEENIPEVYNLKLDVIFEDEQMALINKPAGIIVSGNQFKTIENCLLYNLQKSVCVDALKWPRPVHRLDAPTTGLLIIAKTASAHANLGQQFERKEIKKEYLAIVVGKTEKGGLINTPIDESKAETEYEQITMVPSLKDAYLSLLRLKPYTGRTHQIRIHLSSLGFPIVGDKQYAKENAGIVHKGLFLSAVSLEFKHPATQKVMKFEIPMPHKFKSLLQREQRRWENYH